MAALEEELGVPLLARLHRGGAPTRECQALLPMAREMVHLSSLLAQRSDELRGLVSGSLSVGTAYHHYYPWLSRMIAGFTRRYPGVTINLLEGTSSELCQAVRERRADLCIASRREGPFRGAPIHEGPLVVRGPERHPRGGGAPGPGAARTEKNGIRILPTDPEELISICLVTPLTSSPAARRFLDFAQAHLNALT